MEEKNDLALHRSSADSGDSASPVARRRGCESLKINTVQVSSFSSTPPVYFCLTALSRKYWRNSFIHSETALNGSHTGVTCCHCYVCLCRGGSCFCTFLTSCFGLFTFPRYWSHYYTPDCHSPGLLWPVMTLVNSAFVVSLFCASA